MRLLSRFLALTFPVLASADPVISEFMASNDNSITDENSDHSDWIEIRNPDAAPVNLSGWALTDEIGRPQKWVFPSVLIPAKGHLIVFASGKDRKPVSGNLHTNFSLGTDGEYLALVKPDGTTKTTEFNPFPPQLKDISYGVSNSTVDTVLVDKPTPIRAFVPVDDSLGTTWRAAAFNDSGWTAGTFGVGYFNSGANPNLSSDLGTNLQVGMLGTGRSSYTRAHFNLPSLTGIVKLTLKVNFDDGFYAWINGQYVANSVGAPAESALGYLSPAPNHSPGAFETFDITSKIDKLAQGDNVIAFQGLNANNTSSDCFLWPQLVVTTDTAGSGLTGFFTAATPGAPNGGTDTVFLPYPVNFSHASGTFTGPFFLTLSGAGPGQEIRYVLADPTASPAANIPSPTAASTLYTAPIAISSSKLIRAAIFDPSTGQKGSTTTAQYLLLETGATNNTSNFTSNLPILVLDDHGDDEPVDGAGGSYTTAMLYVFPTVGGTASLNTAPTVFARAGARIRGSSSAGFPKKSYGIELWDENNADLDIALLGLEADSDWVLNGPYQYDNTFMHNAYAFELSRRVGRWAPRTVFCELFLNKNGGKLDYADYNGVYVLTEKIKSNSDRLDIAPMEPTDNAGDALTGGYIFKIDRADPDEVNWITSTGIPNTESGQRLVLVEPDPQLDTTQQVSYIQNYIQTFDTTLLNERNASFATRNYRNYMDTAGWVDHHILNAITYNVDALRLSAFYYKDRGKKIFAGPIWDFDRALGSDDGRDSNPSSWGNITYFFDRDWWGRLFRDPDFVMAWVDRWQQLRTAQFSTANLLAIADQQGAIIGNAAGARDAAKWPANAPIGGGQPYLNEISRMKTWLTTRANWIDGQMPAAPGTSAASGAMAAGTQITLSGAGTIRYTTDGTDPRPAGGGTTSSAPTYTGPITLNQTTVLTTRRQLAATTLVFTGQAAIGTNWSGVTRRVYLVNEFFAIAGDLVVSEINYHPTNPTAAELATLPGVTADEFEFIELRNIGTRTINLFEVRFPDTVPFKELVLAPFTLAPGEVAFVVKNRAAFELRYGTAQSAKIVGEWLEGSLDDNGERLQLFARDGSLIQDFTYNDGGAWPGRPDGKGSTLEFGGTTFTNAAFNNPDNWRASSEFLGSPGANGTGPDNSVLINEVLNHTALPYVDSIELKNPGATPIDLGGWYLSNVTDPEDATNYKQFRIPNGTTIPAGGYLVFNETDFNPNGAWNPAPGAPGPGEFSFYGGRDNDCWLVQADATGKLLRFVDHVEFGAARLNEAWGRWPDGTGPLYPMLARTCVNEVSAVTPKAKLGATNSTPRVGPLLVSEIHHTPASGSPTLEFVEIRNPTASAVDLAGWRLRGDVDFDFTTESLPAGGTLAIVPFAPGDIPTLNVFRAAYQLDAGVTVAGPWQPGALLGTSGTVTLYRADAPPADDPYIFPRILEDTATYASGVGGWPNTTLGLSLNRRGTTLIGDLAASWKADLPSPGTFGPTYAQWLAFFFPGSGPDSEATADPDNDGASNALEYTRGTSPLTAEDQLALAPTLVATTGPDAAYVFTFIKPVDRPGAVYRVQQSTDMTNWSNANDVLVSSTADTETREVRVPINAGTPPQTFFRLRMTFP